MLKDQQNQQPHSDKLLEFHMLAQDWTKPYAGEELIRIQGSVYEK